MEKCPNCGGYLVTYDSVREEKSCIGETCDFKIYYCKHRYRIENDVLPKLVGDNIPRKKRRCITPKGWRECDICELRA